MRVFDVSHAEIILGGMPLNAGGEGSIYEIAGRPDMVAKIYHTVTDGEMRQQKIREMIRIYTGRVFQNSGLEKKIAWPKEMLFDERNHFVGFVMNRIDSMEELNVLYEYPATNASGVTIENKIDVLISMCEIIDRLHQTGQVFGDFNPDNIKISKDDWTVRFLDADSYHIRNDGREYRCIVCAPGYAAPELIRGCHGTTYADCPGDTFTKETDHFALAIHIFRMLMNGCHPYVCERSRTCQSSAKAPRSIDFRVESGETPFFVSVPGYTVPHYAPDIHAFPNYIQYSFQRTFLNGSKDPSKRLTAAEWKAVLIQYKQDIRACRKNPAHFYWKEKVICPYCEADKEHEKKMPTSVVLSAGRNHLSQSVPFVHQGSSRQGRQTVLLTRAVYFWLLTLTIVLGMEILGSFFFLPQICGYFFDNHILFLISLRGSVVAGFAGCIWYNMKWGKKLLFSDWKRYVISALLAAAFTLGFIFAFYAIIIVLLFLLAVLIVAAIIAAFVFGFVLIIAALSHL